jgi:hypothetical protein
MAEQRWIAPAVEERLEEAADTLRRLPEERVRGYFSTWPPVIRDYWEAFGRGDVRLRLPPPSAAAIDRMDEVLAWLSWLESDDARLVWTRAEGAPWKAICWRFGVSRATAHRRWQYSISVIVWRLNGRRVPAKRSREFLVERAQALSSAS